MTTFPSNLSKRLGIKMGTYDIDTLWKWTEVIKTEGKELTEWEESFVDSVRDQIQKRRVLSARQIEILERIYVEKTPN